jgi:hypothetical protein
MMKFTKQELWAWLKAEKHHTPDKDPVKPLHNRSSRRRQGQVRSAQRSARRRKLANAQHDRSRRDLQQKKRENQINMIGGEE